MQSFEKLVMFVFTGLSNFLCFPTLYVVYKRDMVFGFMVGTFTFICSFMYHSMESLEIKKFYITCSQWHELDNIGSILSMIYLIVFMMDNLEYSGGIFVSIYETKADRILCYSGLFVTLFMQAKHPWDIENTVVPILLYASISLFKIIFIRKPRINKPFFYSGLWILSVGIVCFYKGLDDANDYLRIWHGMWHFCGSTSLFYFYQSVPKDLSLPKLHMEPGPKYKHYSYPSTFLYIF